MGGLAGKPFHERRQNWLVSRHPDSSRVSRLTSGRWVSPPGRRRSQLADWKNRHLGGGYGATALPPRGRAVDGVTVGERDHFWQLTAVGQVAGDCRAEC